MPSYVESLVPRALTTELSRRVAIGRLAGVGAGAALATLFARSSNAIAQEGTP